VYKLQTAPPPPAYTGQHIAGFRGGPFAYFGEDVFASHGDGGLPPPHDNGHLAMVRPYQNSQ
jgi:hypothetical protein